MVGARVGSADPPARHRVSRKEDVMFISFNFRKRGRALRLVLYRSATGEGGLRCRWIIDERLQPLDGVGQAESCNQFVTEDRDTETLDVCA